MPLLAVACSKELRLTPKPLFTGAEIRDLSGVLAGASASLDLLFLLVLIYALSVIGSSSWTKVSHLIKFFLCSPSLRRGSAPVEALMLLNPGLCRMVGFGGPASFRPFKSFWALFDKFLWWYLGCTFARGELSLVLLN